MKKTLLKVRMEEPCRRITVILTEWNGCWCDGIRWGQMDFGGI